jgi:hypothetical protein
MVGGASESLKFFDNLRYVFMDYDANDKSTHFETLEYAERIINEIQPMEKNILLYLTNGANPNFNEGGGGTNNAITTLGNETPRKYFTRDKIIKPPYEITEKIYKKMSSVEQKYQKILDFPVGTVIISEPKDPKIYKSITYKKVFHIKGFDFSGGERTNWRKNTSNDDNANEKSDEYKNLVTNYYYQIVKQTFELYEIEKYIVLHLAEIPGNIFLGNSDIVCECMVRGINMALSKLVNELQCKIFIVLPKKCENIQVHVKSSNGMCYMKDIEKSFFGSGVIVVEKNNNDPLVVLFDIKDKLLNNAGGKYNINNKNLITTAITNANIASSYLINIINNSVLTNAYYNDVGCCLHKQLFRTYFICLGDNVINTTDFNSNSSMQIIRIMKNTSYTLVKFKVSKIASSSSGMVEGTDGKIYMIDDVTFKAIKKMIEDKKINEITSEIKHHERKEVLLSTVVEYTDKASKDDLVIINYIS